MIGGGALARRYARALFALGQERGEPQQLLGEIDELTEAATVVPDLERVLFTPLHPREDRRAVVEALARALDHDDATRGLVMLLVDENRMALLPEIRDALRELVEQAAGRVRAQVTSARPLSDAEIDELRRALQDRVQAEVHIEASVDANLIGGVVARVGDLLLDGSLRTQLNSLGGSLRKGSA